MQGFRSWSGLQRFVSTFSALRNLFVPPRSHRSALATHLSSERDGGVDFRHLRYRLKSDAKPKMRPVEINVTSPNHNV